MEVFQSASSEWSPLLWAAFGAHNGRCWTVPRVPARQMKGTAIVRVGRTQVRGDPFPHFLSLGVPAKEEGRGAVAKRGGKSLQIRVGMEGGKSGFRGNFQKPFLTAVPGKPAGREEEEPTSS